MGTTDTVVRGAETFEHAKKLGTPEEERRSIARTTHSACASDTANWYWTKPRRP